ncbi:MAG: Hsp20/alpha crystallin family protein [Syntrophomonadaceae bacterium]|nr:Hsp20/alpha crystallin family protein [Syntrophomonadaceae bacterium]
MFELTPLRARRTPADSWLIPRDFMKDFFGNSFFEGMAAMNIRTDIRETEQAYIVEAEMPGMKKEDIALDWKDDTLTVSATYNEEQQEEKDNFLHRERRRGSFSRSFYIQNVDAQALQAKYEDGILTVTLPKLQNRNNGNHRIAID